MSRKRSDSWCTARTRHSEYIEERRMGRTSISAKGRHGGCSSTPAVILPSEACGRAGDTAFDSRVHVRARREQYADHVF